jgi:hypothetical protein
MVKPGQKKPGQKKPGQKPAQKAGKASPAQKQNPNKPLSTAKGVFTFTMVADGCYIEHKVCMATPFSPVQMEPNRPARTSCTTHAEDAPSTLRTLAVGPELGPRGCAS